MATIIIRADAPTIFGIEAGINAHAKNLETSMPGTGLGDRKIAALALLTNPDAHPDLDTGPVKAKVVLHLHMTPDSPIARMEGHGPVTTGWVRHLLTGRLGPVGQSPKVKVVPVIDLADQTPVDAYEIPARLRTAVRLIHPGDVFPYAANTARTGDIDHTKPWSEGGETAVGNLAPMTRNHHRIKTHTGWDARQPFPGILIWRDPHGAHYLVDNTGTRRIEAA